MSKDFDFSILLERFEISIINDLNVLIDKFFSFANSSKSIDYDTNVHGAIFKILNELLDENSNFVNNKIDFVKLKNNFSKKKLYDILELISKFYLNGYFSFKKVNHLFKLKPNLSYEFLKKKIEKNNFKIKNESFDCLLKFNLDINPCLAYINLVNDSVQFFKVDITKELSDSSCILIDGISLLTYILHHDVDLYNGGQFLHLIFLFERFIRLINEFTEYFYIVFFKDLNNFLFTDKSIYLSINVILAHLYNIPGLDKKVKFFKNFNENDYMIFLEEKKPTFIFMNDLECFNKLRLKLSKKQNIKSIYKLFELKHLSIDVNIAHLNEMTINSNRLNVFYAQPKLENKNNFNNLVKIGYENQIIELYKKEKALQNRDKKFFQKILSNNNFLRKINTLNSVLGDKLTIYSISIIYCYFNKSTEIDDLEFAGFLFLIILNAYIVQKLDLQSRSVKLKKRKSYCNSSFKQLIRLFQNSLAFIISTDLFSFIQLLPSTISDLFDGRIFSLTFLLSRTQGVNWQPLFQKELTSILNNVFIFLKESSKIIYNEENEFNKIIELGTDNATNTEILSLFHDVFKDKSYSLKKLKSKCFDIKTESVDLEINTIKHPLIRNMVKNVFSSDKYEFQFDTKASKIKFLVDNFLLNNKWKDNFKTYNTQLKNENEKDLISDKIVNELNIFSLEFDEFKIIKPKCDHKSYDFFEENFHNKNFIELEEMIINFEMDFKLSFYYLKRIFKVVQILARKEKSELFESLYIKLFTTMDEIWIRLIHNQAEKKHLIKIIPKIIEILDYFNLNTLVNKIKIFTKQNFDIELEDLVKLKDLKLDFDISENRFQLFCLSDILKREIKPGNSNRTSLFKPDLWQEEFLDAIDKNESMLIVAPTSTGKTFSSFYAMKKILETNDDSLLIYVSPTKALANQTAFNVMKNFKNVKLNGNKKVCGIFTRDFRNNLMDCKILITVPQCLFIMLINYYNTSWPSNIKYVVFDEIHSLNGEKSTDIWEYLLLLIKCPFIALSATIGKPEVFNKWLNDLENYKSGRKVRLIHYKESHTDLKKFLFTNQGFRKINPLGYINYENLKKYQTFPSDINLIPSETVELYDNLKKYINLQDLDLDLYTNFQTNLEISLFFTRNSARDYLDKLKEKALEYILENQNCKFLENFTIKLNENEFYPSYREENGNKKNSLCLMVKELFEKNMHPCIVFCNNRYLCEKTADLLMKENLKLNANFKNNRVERFIAELVRTKEIDKKFLKLIELGIGYHHSGMLPVLKSVVEALFRVGKLKVIIATATLALGIHMPCKTVVFMDDQIYLDSFQYRQASGRAGRRGYDQCGNVIFFDISLSKIERLVGSYTTELRPHFPISVSFVMQLFDNVLKSNQNRNLNVDCVLNKSYWNFKYSKINQIGYHAVFSLSFLFQLKLLNSRGRFSAFSNLLEKIHYHEPSNFFFYYLLANNYFHEILKDDFNEKNEDDYLEMVMLLICNLFNRIPVKNKKKNLLPKLDKK
ncbi:unnamed protein product, partial [Brachionus calyciflorus]